MEMQWYTAYTRPNWEKKVTSILSRKKILHFCPNDIISNQESNKVNQSFSCYVFIKMTECQVKEIKKINGIQYIMYWMDRPAIIPESEINLIKSFLTEHSYVKLEKRDNVFSSVLQNNFPQKENEAKLIHLNDNKIKATLPSLRSTMIAEFKKSNVQVASEKISHLRPKFEYKIAVIN